MGGDVDLKIPYLQSILKSISPLWQIWVSSLNLKLFIKISLFSGNHYLLPASVLKSTSSPSLWMVVVFSGWEGGVFSHACLFGVTVLPKKLCGYHSSHFTVLGLRFSWNKSFPSYTEDWKLSLLMSGSPAYKFQGSLLNPNNSPLTHLFETNTSFYKYPSEYHWCLARAASLWRPSQMDKEKDGILSFEAQDQMGLKNVEVNCAVNPAMMPSEGNNIDISPNQLNQGITLQQLEGNNSGNLEPFMERSQAGLGSGGTISAPIQIDKSFSTLNLVLPASSLSGMRTGGDEGIPEGKIKNKIGCIDPEIVMEKSIQVGCYPGEKSGNKDQDPDPKKMKISNTENIDQQEQEEYYDEDGDENLVYDYDIDDRQDQCELFNSSTPFGDTLMSPIINSELPLFSDQDIDDFINYEPDEQQDYPLVSDNSYHSIQNSIHSSSSVVMKLGNMGVNHIELSNSNSSKRKTYEGTDDTTTSDALFNKKSKK